MFHMLSCFNLRQAGAIDTFRASIERFSKHMQNRKLLDGVGKIGIRCTDTPMDTDTQRSHQYFFIMTFKDQRQCDAAYDYIQTDMRFHQDVISKVKDPVFICWEDLSQ